ncbi:MAG: serine/threonine-protein kinase [Polyangiaceae bacterium]
MAESSRKAVDAELPRAAFEVGDVVDGRYELRRIIGSGGEGIVFEATHRYTRAGVALKTIVGHGTAAVVERRKKRLLREARVLGSVKHRGIVGVLDAGIALGDQPYLATELLQGKTVEALLRARSRLAPTDAARIAVEVCEALHAAHAAGVLHRDIKPANVFITRPSLASRSSSGEQAKLIDFGTSKSSLVSGGKVTEDGAIVGTPVYMSPEQLLADELDERTDVYAVGALLFECLTGRVVYPGNYARVIRESQSPAPPPPLETEGVDPELEAVVVKALAKSRDDRFPSAHALGEALRRFAGPPSLRLLRPSTTAQRRRHARVPFLAPVTLRSRDATVEGRCADVSESGLFFLSRHPCDAEWVYEASFCAPLTGRIITSRVRVRWIRTRAGAGWVGGLEFVHPDDAFVREVARFVELMSPAATLEPEAEAILHA